MSTPSPYHRALFIPALGATAITLMLFVAPVLSLGAAAAVLVAGVGLAVHDARLYRRAGMRTRPAVVGGVVSALVGGLGLVVGLSVSARTASAHGAQPRALGLAFSPHAPGSVWVLTDTQGVFADPKGLFRWLCEDAIAPNSGVRGLWFDPVDPARWLVATSHGLFETSDDGCGFARVEGPVGAHRLIGLFAHADGSLLTATASMGTANDVFRSVDGGRSWAAAGLGLAGPVRRVVRHPANGDRVYVSHAGGLLRSDDGGVSFVPLPEGAPAAPSGPDDFRLLEVDPSDEAVVFAAVEGIPETIVLRSTNAGEAWAEVGRVADFGLVMAFDRGSDAVVVGGPVRPPHRSDDRGQSFAVVDEAALPGCLTVAPDGTLWGCRDPYFGAPWAVASSADLGRSWTTRLGTYEEVGERWDCGPAERARRCCLGLCPGLMVPPEACGQPEPADDLIEMCLQPEGYVLTPFDGGVADAAVDAGAVDAAIDAAVGAEPDVGIVDAGPIDDAAPPADVPTSGSDGCSARPGPAGWAWLLVGLLLVRRRR